MYIASLRNNTHIISVIFFIYHKKKKKEMLLGNRYSATVAEELCSFYDRKISITEKVIETGGVWLDWIDWNKL